MRNSICVLLLVSLVVPAAAAQNPTPRTIPNGLPECAYNIPDKVQPPEPKVTASRYFRRHFQYAVPARDTSPVVR